MSDRGARAVILAAGTSSRIGRQKLLMAFRGQPLIEYAIAAARRWNPIVVAGAQVGEYLAGRLDVVVLRNDEPNRGMSYSLALADRFLGADVAMIVLLGDKPLIGDALIDTICRTAKDADVVYPVRGGEPGHPVWLSPLARELIAGLPRGDTLRLLRADPSLSSLAVETQEDGAFFDVDSMAAFES